MKKKQLGSSRRRAFVLGIPLLLAGCATTIPPDAFTVTDALLEQRQLQSRRFDGVTESSILAASSDVLQDMGFNLDNSEVALGLLTASKDRDASSAGEMVGAILMAAFFGVATAVSRDQKIRVSLIVQPAGKDSVVSPSFASSSTESSLTTPPQRTLPDEETGTIDDDAQKSPEVLGNFVVRATFQRIVTRTDNSVYVETINDDEIYQEFFDKLSKSMFIEAHKV